MSRHSRVVRHRPCWHAAPCLPACLPPTGVCEPAVPEQPLDGRGVRLPLRVPQHQQQVVLQVVALPSVVHQAPQTLHTTGPPTEPPTTPQHLSAPSLATAMNQLLSTHPPSRPWPRSSPLASPSPSPPRSSSGEAPGPEGTATCHPRETHHVTTEPVRKGGSDAAVVRVCLYLSVALG